MKIKLEDIIEAMELAGMETEYYYDTQNEKVLMLFDGMVDGEDNPELFENIREGFIDLKLEKQWYQYRDEAYEKIARQWCEKHKINIVE